MNETIQQPGFLGNRPDLLIPLDRNFSLPLMTPSKFEANEKGLIADVQSIANSAAEKVIFSKLFKSTHKIFRADCFASSAKRPLVIDLINYLVHLNERAN